MAFGGSNFSDFPENQLFQKCRFWCILRMKERLECRIIKNNVLTHLGKMPGVDGFSPDLTQFCAVYFLNVKPSQNKIRQLRTAPSFYRPSLHVKRCSVKQTATAVGFEAKGINFVHYTYSFICPSVAKVAQHSLSYSQLLSCYWFCQGLLTGLWQRTNTDLLNRICSLNLDHCVILANHLMTSNRTRSMYLCAIQLQNMI